MGYAGRWTVGGLQPRSEPCAGHSPLWTHWPRGDRGPHRLAGPGNHPGAGRPEVADRACSPAAQLAAAAWVRRAVRRRVRGRDGDQRPPLAGPARRGRASAGSRLRDAAAADEHRHHRTGGVSDSPGHCAVRPAMAVAGRWPAAARPAGHQRRRAGPNGHGVPAGVRQRGARTQLRPRGLARVRLRPAAARCGGGATGNAAAVAPGRRVVEGLHQQRPAAQRRVGRCGAGAVGPRTASD